MIKQSLIPKLYGFVTLLRTDVWVINMVLNYLGICYEDHWWNTRMLEKAGSQRGGKWHRPRLVRKY